MKTVKTTDANHELKLYFPNEMLVGRTDYVTVEFINHSGVDVLMRYNMERETRLHINLQEQQGEFARRTEKGRNYLKPRDPEQYERDARFDTSRVVGKGATYIERIYLGELFHLDPGSRYILSITAVLLLPIQPPKETGLTLLSDAISIVE